MRIGVRQRLIILVFIGLFVAMNLIGAYRYFMEKQAILAASRDQAEQTGKLVADVAGPLMMMADYSSLQYLAQNVLHMPDVQDVVIFDSGGREVVRTARPALAEKRLALGPFPLTVNQARLGELRISVYPADLGRKLRSYAVAALFEHAFIFFILAGLLYVSVSRIVTGPVEQLGATLKEVIDRKDFTKRVDSRRKDEIGVLADGVNYLIERLEKFIIGMDAVASRIGDLGPRIAKAIDETRQGSEAEAASMKSVVASVHQMASTVGSVAESSESLSASAEESSSAILEMNASNQEVARHTGELKSSIEEVTTSVMEMIAAIREVAQHIETVSSAAEETSASAIQIEATAREVERAAKESSKLSQQVSAEARDIGVRSIGETTEAMTRIKESVAAYSDLITRLGKRSEEIGKILGVIVEVTERTNLLALNASILAAQAGEHGRGFAVVAEEIKALADRTAGSAQDIGKLIAAVQKETKEAVAAMADSLIAVDEGVNRSKAATAALNKILESSDRSAETANMIERSMSEQSRGIKQVSEAVSNVKQMMNQIAAATQAQSKGTEMILGASEGMRDISRQVNNAMIEQERGGKQIAMAAENVTARAATIAASTRQQGSLSSAIREEMERIQELPLQNVRLMEAIAASVKDLEDDAQQLKQQLMSMTDGKSVPEADQQR